MYKLETSIDTRIVQSFRLGFFLYIMSRDQFFIFRFVHEVEVFGRLPKPLSSSCLTNRVLFSGPWAGLVSLSIFVFSKNLVCYPLHRIFAVVI